VSKPQSLWNGDKHTVTSWFVWVRHTNIWLESQCATVCPHNKTTRDYFTVEWRASLTTISAFQTARTKVLVFHIEILVNNTYLLFDSLFIFSGALSPPKRRAVAVRWQNFAHRRIPTMCRTCAGFYVYRGSRCKNNDIFPIFSGIFAAYTTWLAGSTLGRWLPGCSIACYCDITGVSLSDWPNVGRWPKRAGCSSAVQSFTKSNCSDPTSRNSLYYTISHACQSFINHNKQQSKPSIKCWFYYQFCATAKPITGLLLTVIDRINFFRVFG